MKVEQAILGDSKCLAKLIDFLRSHPDDVYTGFDLGRQASVAHSTVYYQHWPKQFVHEYAGRKYYGCPQAIQKLVKAIRKANASKEKH